MLKSLKSLQPVIAIATAVGSIVMGTFVRANPVNTPHQSIQAQLIANSNTGIRRYGSGRVALDKQIETVSGESELALAEHLVKSGAKFYGAYWCSRSEERRVGKEC